MRACMAAVGLVSILAFAMPCAEDAGGGFGPGRPPSTPLWWWDNYSFLREPQEKPDLFDPIKFVAFDETKKNYGTFGFEYKERYENWSNAALGNGPAHDPSGYLLTRLIGRADFHFDPHFRVYLEMKSCFQAERNGPTRAFDEDRLEVNAAFVEAGTPLCDGESIYFRIGRQEMHYGLGRLIEVRDSLNNRQSFDEVKMMLKLKKWEIDAWVSQPVVEKVGVFDNQSSKDYIFSGIYAVCRNSPIKGAGLDVYLLRNDVKDALFWKGIEDQHRNTVGARLYGRSGNFDYDVESMYQFGGFGDGRISAWATSNELGYSLPKLPAAPRPYIHLDAFSGDDGPGDHSLETFDSLFPRGQYYSEPSPIGKQNIMDVRPAIDFHPHHDITVTAANVWYWRQSIHDGTYYFNGFPQLAPTNTSRYIGSETVMNFEWRAQAHLTFTTAISHFTAGDFVRKSPHGKDFNFLATWITFRF
jgi:hypothetical protein